jgi:hypothetical protein
MQRAPFRGLLLAASALTLTAALAPAGFPIPAPPLPERVALAECIVVGTVTEVKADLVSAFSIPKIPGAPKVSHRLAVVRVETVVAGAKDMREIQVGFVVPKGPARRGDFQWTAGQAGCFFVRKHPDERFHVLLGWWDLLDKAKTKDFDRDLALVKRCAKLLADPGAGLRSRDREDRLLTAGMLIVRYRTPQHVYRDDPKTEPIDGEQSKLILSALAEGDWTDKDVRDPMGRLRLFSRIGLTDEDGWKPPASAQEAAQEAQKWLRANSATYRIRRYVPEEESGRK